MRGPNRRAESFDNIARTMKVTAFIFLVGLTGCSTGSQRSTSSSSVLSAEYWHAPPPVAVLQDSLRVGMPGDDFARLVGIAEPAFISCMTSHHFLADGVLSARHDARGILAWWSIQESVTE